MVKMTTWLHENDFLIVSCVDQLAFVGGEVYDTEIKAALETWAAPDDNVYIITIKQAESLENLLTSKGFVVKS